MLFALIYQAWRHGISAYVEYLGFLVPYAELADVPRRTHEVCGQLFLSCNN